MWNEDETANRVEGSAVDFCKVVTQATERRRHGAPRHAARSRTDWMTIVQCFAGPPEDPPAPGSVSPSLVNEGQRMPGAS